MDQLAPKPRLAQACVLAAICAVIALAGCAQGNSSADLAPAAPQQAAAPVVPPPAAPEAPMTPEKAKADCWMKYENDKKIKISTRACNWWRNASTTRCAASWCSGRSVDLPQTLAEFLRGL